MKQLICNQCGANQFFEIDGYKICQFCQTKHVKTIEEVANKESTINLSEDIRNLLQKCRDDPRNARRYASLVLDLDPSNAEAQKYF